MAKFRGAVALAVIGVLLDVLISRMGFPRFGGGVGAVVLLLAVGVVVMNSYEINGWLRGTVPFTVMLLAFPAWPAMNGLGHGVVMSLAISVALLVVGGAWLYLGDEFRGDDIP